MVGQKSWSVPNLPNAVTRLMVPFADFSLKMQGLRTLDMSKAMLLVGKLLRTKRPDSIEPNTKLEVKLQSCPCYRQLITIISCIAL